MWTRLVSTTALVVLVNFISVASSTQAAPIQITEFCSPSTDSWEEELQEWLSNHITWLADVPRLELVVLEFDVFSENFPIAELQYFGSLYVVGPSRSLVAICAPGKVFPDNPRLDSPPSVTESGAHQPDMPLISFDVWTNCGTGCAYDSVYMVRFDEDGFSEYYVVGTGRDSSLLFRPCPLQHEFSVQELEVVEPKVRGRLTASIWCGDERSACLFKLTADQIELSGGSGIPLFEETGVVQFSVPEHPTFQRFVEQHERFFTYWYQGDPTPEVCRHLEFPLTEEQEDELRALGVTHYLVDGSEYPLL